MTAISRLFVCALLCGVMPAWSETLEWAPGLTIDCPTNIVANDQERTRTIVLPCQSITSWSMSAKSKDLTVKQGDRNALILRLTNPSYETNLQVWDENQNLYTFLVRSPAEGEAPDDTLILKVARQAGGVGAGQAAEAGPRIVNQDTDGAAVHLMSQMASGVTDPKVRWANVTTTERGGKIRPGRILHNSDDLTITLLKTYRSPTLYGYECMMEWHGDQTVAFQLQRWYRPGMICCATSDQVVLHPVDPSVQIPAHRTIRVWYVTDAGALSSVSAEPIAPATPRIAPANPTPAGTDTP